MNQSSSPLLSRDSPPSPTISYPPLILMFLSGMLFWSSLSCLLTTMPQYVQDLGADNRQVGLVMGAFAIGLITSRRWLGPLADKNGRKVVLMLGLLVTSLAPLGYLAGQSLLPIGLVRVFHGVSVAGFTTGYIALVTDITPPQIRGTAIGYMTMVNPVAMMLGPLLGDYLMVTWGYTPLFLTASGLGWTGLLLMAAVYERRSPRKCQTEQKSVNISALLTQPRLLTPTLILMCTGLAFGSLTAFMPLFVRGSGLGIEPKWFYLSSAIVTILVRFRVGRLSDRIGRGVFVTAGLFLMMMGLCVLASARQPQHLVIAGAFQGAGFGTIIPMMSALLADRSQPHERGTLFGLCLGGFDVGLAGAGFVLGVVADLASYRWAFLSAAGLLFLAVGLFATQSGPSPRASWRFALGRGQDSYAVVENSYAVVESTE